MPSYGRQTGWIAMGGKPVRIRLGIGGRIAEGMTWIPTFPYSYTREDILRGTSECTELWVAQPHTFRLKAQAQAAIDMGIRDSTMRENWA